MLGRNYCCVGHGDDPTQEKLDTVLVSMEWEEKFPLCTVDIRNRVQFDHTLIKILVPRHTLLVRLHLNLKEVGSCEMDSLIWSPTFGRVPT